MAVCIFGKQKYMSTNYLHDNQASCIENKSQDY